MEDKERRPPEAERVKDLDVTADEAGEVAGGKRKEGIRWGAKAAGKKAGIRHGSTAQGYDIKKDS